MAWVYSVYFDTEGGDLQGTRDRAFMLENYILTVIHRVR
jgi:hypothetical protein